MPVTEFLLEFCSLLLIKGHIGIADFLKGLVRRGQVPEFGQLSHGVLRFVHSHGKIVVGAAGRPAIDVGKAAVRAIVHHLVGIDDQREGRILHIKAGPRRLSAFRCNNDCTRNNVRYAPLEGKCAILDRNRCLDKRAVGKGVGQGCFAGDITHLAANHKAGILRAGAQSGNG